MREVKTQRLTKIEEVTKYCGVTSCKDCVLRGEGWEHSLGAANDENSCLRIFEASEAELDRALGLMYGEEV